MLTDEFIEISILTLDNISNRRNERLQLLTFEL